MMLFKFPKTRKVLGGQPVVLAGHCVSPHGEACTLYDENKERPESIARRFLRQKANLYPHIAKLILQDRDDWIQEARWRFFAVLVERLAGGQATDLINYAAKSTWNRLRDCWKALIRYRTRVQATPDPWSQQSAKDIRHLLNEKISKDLGPVERASQKEEAAQVQQALRELELDDCVLHNVARLAFQEELTNAEIAKRLGINEKAAERARARAQSRLSWSLCNLGANL